MDRTVLDALQAILDGSTPDSVETQYLDFKEDPAFAARTHGNPDAERMRILLDAAVCFANADGESFIVLGLRDKASGPDAFTGTEADPAMIANKIFNRTRPNLTVEAEDIEFAGTRLVTIRVGQGLALYSRLDGAATIRHETSCIPLTEDERRHIQFTRANPDHTAARSRTDATGLDAVSLAEGMRRFNTLHPDDAVVSEEDLLRRLGLRDARGNLLVAASILFAYPFGARPTAQHLWRSAPGAEPAREDLDGPLILALPRMLERIKTHSNAEIERIELPTGQERHIRDFPSRAVDEVVLNAFAHRDWTLTRPIVVEQSPLTLRVTSPGGLPEGVERTRLLTTTSTPRNPVLMNALHRLGLVEETSRGFDRMWVSMLSSGRDIPDVETDDFHVALTFASSVSDPGFVKALALLPDVIGDAAVGNVNVLLVLKRLITRTSALTETTASALLQTGAVECREILAWMVGLGLLMHDPKGRSWSLSSRVRDILRSQAVSVPASGEIRAWIIDAVAAGSVTNQDVASATGTPSNAITEVLRHLASTGVIEKDPTGPSRGTAVRWRAARMSSD